MRYPACPESRQSCLAWVPKLPSMLSRTAFAAVTDAGLMLSSSKKFFDMVRSVVLMGVTACNVAARAFCVCHGCSVSGATGFVCNNNSGSL